MKTIDEGVWGIIEDACETDGLEDVRKDYAGRAMFGTTCIGVVGSDFGDAVQFMVNVVEALEQDVMIQKSWLILLAKDLKTDSMGKDVIYYFPGWTVD